MSLMEIYSKDLRIRALAAVDRGIPRREVVEIFAISLTTLKRWIKMRREGKDLSPGVSTGRRRRILSTPEEEGLLWNQLEENDDATLKRHCELWEEKTGVRVSVSAMSRAIRERLGWSYKKTLGATERDEQERAAFRERLRGVDAERLLFVDESSTNVALTPR
jgi:transposase